MKTTSSRRRLSWPSALALVALGLLAVWYGKRRFDRWMYPWADIESGHPVLLGTWVGQLTTGGGRPRAVMMEVVREQRKHTRRSRCRNCDDGIEGQASTCDERGRVWRYSLDGTPEDRAVSRIHGQILPAESPPPDGLALSSFRGGWDGADALNLSVEFYWRRGASAITSSGDPDTKGWVPLPLRRGTAADFESRCRKIRGQPIAEIIPQ